MRQLNAIGKVKVRIPNFCAIRYSTTAELIDSFAHQDTNSCYYVPFVWYCNRL